MKVKYISILFVFVALTWNSCGLLDETSPNDIDASGAIQNADQAENALVGLYSSLQNANYYGGNYLLIADALGGNSTTGGFDNPLLDEIGAKTVTSSNGLVEELWLTLYRTIANCNYLLEALPAVGDIDADRSGQIEGQARAIRALAHFDLLRYFGYHWDTGSEYGIPVVQTIQSVEDIVPRSTVSASYQFITTELEAALGLVDPDDKRQQFINSASIHALLARVYLYQKNYTDAVSHATAVIDDPTFSLLEKDAFSSLYSSRRTTESIFELAFDNQNRSEYNSLTYSRPDALRTELFFLASPSLAAFFENRPDDVRATLQDYDPANHDESITSDGSGRTEKYRGEDTKDNPAYILRLAEMYLIRAEARGKAGGMEDLNTLRLLRGLTEITPVTDDDFLNAVLDERRAELNFEGHIYFDLARTGRITEVADSEFRAALPIPLREITATAEALRQNPGY